MNDSRHITRQRLDTTKRAGSTAERGGDPAESLWNAMIEPAESLPDQERVANRAHRGLDEADPRRSGLLGSSRRQKALNELSLPQDPQEIAG